MRFLVRYSSCLCLLTVLALISSCATPPPPPPPDPNKPKPLYEWDAEAAAKETGPVSVKIVLDQQKATIYKGDKQIGWTTVASGTASHPTPAGQFNIKEKTVDKKSNLYGKIYDAEGKLVNSDAKMGEDAIPEGGKFVGSQMSYWMRVTNDGVGMHIGPIPRPGRPASHGCIRLPRQMAKNIYSVVSLGTPVTIVKSEGSSEELAQQDAEQGKQKPTAARTLFGKRTPAPAPSTNS